MRLKITITIILIHLLIGNGFFLSVGNNQSINYNLILGMSISTIVLYFMFFYFSNFENYGNIKLFFATIINCIIIIISGNLIAIAIYEGEISIYQIPKYLFMGILGNIIMFPFVLGFGIIDFIIIKTLK